MSKMKNKMFGEEAVPTRGQATRIANGIKRIVANNASKMTYHGTNTYILDTPAGTIVIDPGPSEDTGHMAAIIRELGNNPGGILITHHHSDHFGAAPALREKTGLPIYISDHFPDDAFEPDEVLKDGQTIAGLTVLHTPGHASDHLCFARSDGALFSGDHVMSWNSSIVSPPDGNMSEYCEQLSKLLARQDRIYFPGHGPSLKDPKAYVRRLLCNRMRRELEILSHLSKSPDVIGSIAVSVYKKTDPHIAQAAERNVLAHLEKLMREERVAQIGDMWSVYNLT